MPQHRPFHRNVRGMKAHPNSGYSSWAYIIDREYAKDPSHYVRAFILIQNDLRELFEFVEPSVECKDTYSYRIHALLMRSCIEVEANFKAIFRENIFSKSKPSMVDYRKIDATHHLSSYEVLLPIWEPYPKILMPFEQWKAGESLPWYQAYNASKHNRHEAFKTANLENLVAAVAGLLVVISSQFRNEDFEPSTRGLALEGLDYHEMEAATGSLFRIKYPEDWTEDELYEFDWSNLQSDPNRFARINYDAIP
jgi:hypothetical protein